MSFLQIIIKIFLARKREYVCIYLQIESYTLSGAILGDRLAMRRAFIAIGGGKLGMRGGKWGDDVAGVGIEGAGSGDRVPPVHPTIKINWTR